MATIRARTQTTPIMTRALDAFCSATSEGIGDSLLTNCWFVYWSTFKIWVYWWQKTCIVLLGLSWLRIWSPAPRTPCLVSTFTRTLWKYHLNGTSPCEWYTLWMIWKYQCPSSLLAVFESSILHSRPVDLLRVILPPSVLEPKEKNFINKYKFGSIFYWAYAMIDICGNKYLNLSGFTLGWLEKFRWSFSGVITSQKVM